MKAWGELAARVEELAARAVRQRWLVALLVAYACARAIATLVGNFELKFAWDGYGAMDWIWVKQNPAAVAVDWRNGVEDFAKSLVMHVYPLAHGWLGIEPETLAPWLIGLEVVGLAAAFAYFARVLVPDIAPVPLALAVLVLVLGNGRDVNIASFGQPAFIGQYYVALDVCRVFAIVCLLRGKLAWSALWAALAVTVHPALGVMGAAVLFAMWLANRRASTAREVVTALAIFALVAGGWLSVAMRGAGLSAGGIPAQRWHEIAELMSFHWYPASLGVFTVNHTARFLPFLSFLLLLAHYFPPRRELLAKERQVVAGVAVALALCATGCVLSALHASPSLIKLALHRSNDLVVLLGGVLVVRGLFEDLRGDSWPRRFAAAGLLVSPVLHAELAGWPLACAAWLAAPTLVRAARTGAVVWDRIGGGLLLAIGALLVGYALLGVPLRWTSLAYFGIEGFAIARVPYLAVVLVALGVVVAWPGLRELRALVVLVAAVLLCVHAVERRERVEKRPVARAYADVQLWARDHTPEDALFMVDPGHCYGFRDYSRRASFGCVMEWLHKSWVYNADAGMFRQGMQRFDELGLPLERYLRRRAHKVGYRDLLRDARKRYAAFDDGERARLARAYGIDYFVLERRHARGERASQLVHAYRNEHYLVLASP